MRLNQRDGNRDIPKDYILQRQTVNTEAATHLTPNTYLFTERDLPGHENNMVVFGEARSALYESVKREARKRERGKRWEPYVRRTIPSMCVGYCARELMLMFRQSKLALPGE